MKPDIEKLGNNIAEAGISRVKEILREEYGVTLETVGQIERGEIAPVVRCKDCTHSSYIPRDMGGYFRCGLTEAYMQDMSFCSYGEKRERG